MTERPSPGEQLAGIAGLALLLTMFLFAWYGIDVPGSNGFDAFDAFDDWVVIILAFTSFAAMALALAGGDGRARVPLSIITTVLGAVSAVILLIYLISPPGIPTFGEVSVPVDLDREFGIWLGWVLTIAIAITGYMAMQDEGLTFADAADRLSEGREEQPPAGAHPPTTPPSQQPPPAPSSQQPPPPPPPQSPPPPPQR